MRCGVSVMLYQLHIRLVTAPEMQVDGLHAGIQQQTRYKHNINGSIVQFNMEDRSPSCHGDQRRQQVDMMAAAR